MCVNPGLSGVPVLACPAGPWAPAGAPPGETPVRDAPCPAQLQLGFWLSAMPLGWRSGLLLRWAGQKTPECRAAGPAKNAAAWRREKKDHSAPPLLCFQVTQAHRKIILSSVVATSTSYTRTRVRLRLRTQLVYIFGNKLVPGTNMLV